MSDTELQFRTSTFGGFQKQDVLNYIETSNQEHREKLEAVRRELAEAEAAKAAQAGGDRRGPGPDGGQGEGAPGPAGSWPPPTRRRRSASWRSPCWRKSWRRRSSGWPIPRPG
ncbi:MAG: hypothetical protein ACLRIS_00150 [Flavonifractor plautii]